MKCIIDTTIYFNFRGGGGAAAAAAAGKQFSQLERRVVRACLLLSPAAYITTHRALLPLSAVRAALMSPSFWLPPMIDRPLL